MIHRGICLFVGGMARLFVNPGNCNENLLNGTIIVQKLRLIKLKASQVLTACT